MNHSENQHLFGSHEPCLANNATITMLSKYLWATIWENLTQFREGAGVWMNEEAKTRVDQVKEYKNILLWPPFLLGPKCTSILVGPKTSLWQKITVIIGINNILIWYYYIVKLSTPIGIRWYKFQVKIIVRHDITLKYYLYSNWLPYWRTKD